MLYEVFIEKTAQKNLARIPPPHQDRIIEAIHDLSTVPRPSEVKKLSGRDAWRIRIGHYRVIYETNDQKLVILVVKVGHRKQIYRE